MKRKLNLPVTSLLLLTIAIGCIQKSNAQTVVKFSPNDLSSGNWTVPAGVSQIKVELWGGGGAGGGTTAPSFPTTSRFGSGGGGGAYNSQMIPVSVDQIYSVTYGGGGLGQNGAAGQQGTQSSFTGPGGVNLIAAPGLGGGANGVAIGTGGAGTFAGGNGALPGNNNSGGGGGGAGNNSKGSDGVNSNTNAAAGGTGSPNASPYSGGAGGAAKSVAAGNVNGNAAATGTGIHGGGGGGSVSLLFGSTKAGGNGSAGEVIITYCPTYLISTISSQTPICSKDASSNISITAPAANLPVGNYNVSYTRSGVAGSVVSPMHVTTAGSGSFAVTGLTSTGTTTITVTNIASTDVSFCSNNITSATSSNTVDVFVNQSPSVFTVGGGGPYCSGASGVTINLSNSELGVNYQLFNGVTGGAVMAGTGTPISFSNITAVGTYTIMATNALNNCTVQMTGSASISINPLPVFNSLTNSNPVICIGSSSNLGGVGTAPSTGTLINDNFNGTPSFTGGSGANFSQKTSPNLAGITVITNNDGTSFMMATAVLASTNSQLTSPLLNTTASGDLTLTFRHSYKKGNEAGVSIQVSTDANNTVWSNINTAGSIIGTNTFTGNQGANNNFVPASVDLTAFINQANFKIRFNFNCQAPTGTAWWAIDDVLITGHLAPFFSWSANTSNLINGLPPNAGNLSLANKNIIVTPSQTTIYTLTVGDPITNCPAAIMSTTTVTVNQNSTLALSSAEGTNAQVICIPDATFEDITYDTGGGAVSASMTAGTLPAGLTASYNAGVFSITGTPTQTGEFNYTITTTGPCVNVSLSGTISVHSAPGLVCPDPIITNADPGTCSASRTYNATATGFPSPVVSYLVNGDFIEFPYNFPEGTTTVEVLAEGACSPDATCNFTVTVKDVEAPVPDLTSLPDVSGECSATISDVPTATDICEGPINGTTTDPLTYSTQGTHIVTWSFTDSKGNTSIQTQNVVVNDVTPPEITCPSPQAFCLVAGNNYTIPVLVASDNCGISSITYQVTGTTSRSGNGNDATGTFNPGASTIEWTVTDGNNNSTVCSTTVMINIIPEAPMLTGITNVCPYLGTGNELTYTAASTGATSYTWTIPPNVIVVSGQGTSNIVLKFNTGFSSQANKQLRVTASSVCGTSSMNIFYLLTQFPGVAKPINGPTNICTYIETGAEATYTISPVLSATFYDWSAPSGATITHPNGTGINDTTINVIFDNSYGGGEISVVAGNGCGANGGRSVHVPRTPSPTPGLITGSTNVCSNILPIGIPANYSITPVSVATSYTWSVPPGSIVSHSNPPGPKDTSIIVQYPAGFNNGIISVSSTNGCGTGGTRSLAISKQTPGTPGKIDVSVFQNCPNRLIKYTLGTEGPGIPSNATLLQWVVPAEGNIVSDVYTGTLRTSITVSYSGAVNSFVTVQAFNDCGSSAIRSTAAKYGVCALQSPLSKMTTIPNQNEMLDVNVFPNPSINDFKLKVSSLVKEQVHVRILDIQGREFKAFNMLPDETLTIGADLKAGAYLLIVTQGNKQKTVKMVKF